MRPLAEARFPPPVNNKAARATKGHPPSRRWAALLWLCAMGTGPAHADIDRAALIGLSASVLKVEAERTQGGYSLGSGVVVGSDRVVTNCHVTHDAEQIFVIRGGVRWRVGSESSDAYHDLCLLRVPGLHAEPVAIGQASQLAIGQPVAALGYTGGLELQSSQGEVIALHRMDGSVVVQSSNFFSSGASGGGLFDAQLHLVGILSFRLRGGNAHYFAAPIDWLLPRLQGDAGEHDVKPLAPGDQAFWQRPVEAQPLFLRAAVLERDGHWADLQPLASAWTRTDATDPEAWYMLGLALDEQNHNGDARHALECALAADPAFVPARLRLEPIYQRLGRPAPPAAAGPTCRL